MELIVPPEEFLSALKRHFGSEKPPVYEQSHGDQWILTVGMPQLGYVLMTLVVDEREFESVVRDVSHAGYSIFPGAWIPKSISAGQQPTMNDLEVCVASVAFLPPKADKPLLWIGQVDSIDEEADILEYCLEELIEEGSIPEVDLDDFIEQYSATVERVCV